MFEKFLNELKQFTIKTTELNQVINSVNNESHQSHQSSNSLSESAKAALINKQINQAIKSQHSSPLRSQLNAINKELINNNVKICETASDSGLPSSSNNSDSSRANSYNLVLHELKGE